MTDATVEAQLKQLDEEMKKRKAQVKKMRSSNTRLNSSVN
jgi:hypothetical protein